MHELRSVSATHQSLQQARSRHAPWLRWGPHLSERQWGTVREDQQPTRAELEYELIATGVFNDTHAAQVRELGKVTAITDEQVLAGKR